MIRGETQVPLHELKRLVQAAGGTYLYLVFLYLLSNWLKNSKISKYDLVTDYRVIYKMPFLCTTCRRAAASVVEKVWTSIEGYIHCRRAGGF